VVGALHEGNGLTRPPTDPDLMTASAGRRVVTPSGMVMDGSKDKSADSLLTSLAELGEPTYSGSVGSLN